MKNSKKIWFYAKQLQNSCTLIFETTMESQFDSDSDRIDPIAAQILLNELEQAQTLVLALTENITEAVERSEEEAQNSDGEGSAFASGDLNSQKNAVEALTEGEKKEA